MKEIIFIGDSLTGFYDWQSRFPAYRVQNLGSPGEPVEGLLERLDRLKFLRSPDCLFLMTGINNLRRGDLDIAGRYMELLDFLAADMRDGLTVIQSILPVTLWVHQVDIEHINSRVSALALERGMKYLDLYQLFLDSKGGPDAGCLEEDGIHLSSKGYDIWSGAIETFLYEQNKGAGGLN